MDARANAIAALLLDNVPHSYCFPCLGAKLGLSQGQARDAAQPLVLFAGFRVTRLRCTDCLAEGDLLQPPQADWRVL